MRQALTISIPGAFVGWHQTERGNGGALPISDEEALGVQAGELIAAHGRRAAQYVVDEIQHALRLDDEARAQQKSDLLRMVERKLRRAA